MGLFSDLLDVANAAAGNDYRSNRRRNRYDDDDDEIRVVGVSSVNTDNTKRGPIRVGVWNADDED